MAVTVAVTYTGSITIDETLDSTTTPSAEASSRKIRHSAYNKSASLTGSTTPAVTKTANNSVAMTAGAATLDLTAIPGTEGVEVNATALKVILVKLRNPSGNANNITIAEGAANGFPLFGAGFSVTLAPGQEIQAYLGNGGSAVGVADAEIDITGTGTQALDYSFVFGT